MKAVIVSQQFNNGHVAGILGWYEMFRYLGIETSFYMDKQYQEYLSDKNDMFVNSLNCLVDCDILLIFNLSIKDNKLINTIRKIKPDIKVLFLHHEPWRGLSEEKSRLLLSPVLCAKILTKKFLAKEIIKKTDCVILPSTNSFEIYKRNESKYNNKFEKINLVMLDSSKGEINYKKKYFSFIATASRDKAIDVFFEFVKYCDEKNENIDFLVITKSDISRYLDDDLNKIINSKKMIVKCGKPFSEEEMNDAYNNSLCTWLAYRSSSQSGVLPKCFMWGSPVVASRTGVFEEQINGRNGLLIDSIYDFESILDAYRKITENQEGYISNSRKTYEQLYSVENNAKILWRIINSL